MSDQTDPPIATDGDDADLRRIAVALVAEAPPAPPFPLAVEQSDGTQSTGLSAPISIERKSRRTWPVVIAASVLLIAGFVALVPQLRSSEQVSTSTVAAQPEQVSPSTVPTTFPTAKPAVVEATEDPATDNATAPQFHTPGLSAPGLSLVAKVVDFPGIATMSVYDEPGGEPRLLVDQNAVDGVDRAFSLAHPTAFGEPLVLRVVEGAIGDQWVQVQAPSRPHDRTVWIPTDRFEFAQTDLRIEVDIAGPGQLTMFTGDEAIVESPIVYGRKERPTALHATYVEQIFPGTRLGPAYGNWFMSLASFSEVLGSFGANGSLPGQSIHGTNQPELMGHPISSGGIRVPDPTMERIVSVPNLLGAQVLKFDSDDPDANKEAILSRPWLPAKTAPYTENSGVPIIAYS